MSTEEEATYTAAETKSKEKICPVFTIIYNTESNCKGRKCAWYKFNLTLDGVSGKCGVADG